jgi:hypothetical protein
MKKFISLFVVILSTYSLFAQAPQKMSYQAVIRNSNNELVASKSVGMRVSILQGSVTGTAVYSELHNTTTNANGLATIEIGGGTSPSGTFLSINWANGTYFIKTETDPNGGTTYSITATTQLLSVPYALYAANAGKVTNGGGFTHYIGEQFGGGVIFHLWKDSQGGEHGLIVALTDQSTGTPWSNITDQEIGSSAQSSWNGLANSNAIVAQPGHTSSAAKLCLDLVSEGQSDWYLPSIDELSLLWHNRFNVNKSLSAILGAAVLPVTGIFWTSTEYDNDVAWYFYFSEGYPNNYDFNSTKLVLYYVRAIRAF